MTEETRIDEGGGPQAGRPWGITGSRARTLQLGRWFSEPELGGWSKRAVVPPGEGDLRKSHPHLIRREKRRLRDGKELELGHQVGKTSPLKI